MKTHTVVLTLPVFLLTLTSTASAEPSDPAQVSSFVAPQDQATVVFARPRFLLKTTKLRILDRERRCVAMLKGKRHAVLAMEPGEHSLVAFMRKDAKQIDLDLEAGRTYVVRTRPHGVYPTRIQIIPAKRNAPAFDEAKAWLAESKPYTSDLEACSKSVQKKRSSKKLDTALDKERARRAEDPKYRETHSLTPQDGRTPEESMSL